MWCRIVILWIILIDVHGNTVTENIVEGVLPLLNPKLIFNFLKNSTHFLNQWKNFTLHVGSKVILRTKHDRTLEKSGYIKGYALKYPKNYENQRFQIIRNRNNSDNEIFDEGRSKRGVVHLANMISCATGCNPVSYKGYGCYCGFLGSGYPVDGIDRCCKQHDWCYDVAKCPMYLEYFVPYYWKCSYNQPYCAIEHGEFGGPGSCADRLCECDRQLSMCLKQYRCPQKRPFCKSSPFRLFQNIFMIFSP